VSSLRTAAAAAVGAGSRVGSGRVGTCVGGFVGSGRVGTSVGGFVGSVRVGTRVDGFVGSGIVGTRVGGDVGGNPVGTRVAGCTAIRSAVGPESGERVTSAVRTGEGRAAPFPCPGNGTAVSAGGKTGFSRSVARRFVTADCSGEIPRRARTTTTVVTAMRRAARITASTTPDLDFGGSEGGSPPP
jgi:hypothetical protein